MIRRAILALALLVAATASGLAQNRTCPTRPAGDSSNACASTAFVQGGIALPSGQILVGNAQNHAAAVPMSGSCTMSTTGAISCATGTPAGANGSIQYNNAGAFGGVAQVAPAQGGTGIDNSASATGDLLSYNGTGFIHAAFSATVNAACTASPSACAGVFGYYSPSWYGAKCDGVTHDEVGFQNAVNAAVAANAPLQLPIGNCILNATISNGTSLFEKTIITGRGEDSVLTFLGNNGIAFGAQASYYQLSNFQVICTAASTAPCVKVFHASQSTSYGSSIDRLIIQGGITGLYLQNVVQLRVRSNTILSTNTTTLANGLYIDDSLSADVGGNTVEGNLIINNSGGTAQWGIGYLNAGGTTTINNNVSGYNYDIFYSDTLTSGAATGIDLLSNQLDNFFVAGIWFVSSNAGGFGLVHLNINGNTLHANQPAAGSSGVVINARAGAAWVSNIVISGNTIDTYNGNGGITLASASAFAVTGNSIIDSGGSPAGNAISAAASTAICTIVGNVVSQYSVHVSNSGGCTAVGNN